MSRIIKAAHLIIDSKKKDLINTQENSFTQNDAEVLYEETRKIVLELIDNAKKKSEDILNSARKEAADINLQATLESEKITKEAQLQGFEQGKEEGLQEVNILKQKATEIIKDTYLEREKILKNAENEIINIAIQVSEKIIRNKIESENETVKKIAADLIKKFTDNKMVFLKVNEADYANINENLSELQGLLTQGLLKIEIDQSLKLGDCIVISESGIIEAKISAQLNKIKKSLLEVNSNAGF